MRRLQNYVACNATSGDLFSLGSMVQNGKFSAGAAAFVRTLKKVDFLHVREWSILLSCMPTPVKGNIYFVMLGKFCYWRII